jgi:uncharacterized membrane protein (DUF4010 family)
MELSTLFQNLGISLGLGLLVGLQRESVATPLAGLRTFPLVTILGTVCALLGETFGGGVIATGLVALAAMIFAGKVAEIRKDNPDSGLTTEIAMLLMFAVGAYLVIGHRAAAISIGGGVAVLLHFKGQLHRIVARLGENDLKGIMQFTLISLVILPVLPNRAYGPLCGAQSAEHLVDGCSDRRHQPGWVYRLQVPGPASGIVLGGILGGMISSTATTVSYARSTKEASGSAGLAAIVIMIASTVVFARLLLEIATVAPAFLFAAGPPLVLLLATMAALSAALWLVSRKEEHEMPAQENPTELRSALLFGLIYAAVLFAVAAVRERFGSGWLYAVAAVSGLTDVDAITLSTSQLVNTGRLSTETGWKVIVLAALSNLIFKAGAVAALGHRQLLVRIASAYAVALAVGLAILVFWPESS